jgi:hypothetical protein
MGILTDTPEAQMLGTMRGLGQRISTLEAQVSGRLISGFMALKSGNRAVGAGTHTVQFDTEIFDIAGDYDIGAYAWTPPEGYIILGTQVANTGVGVRFNQPEFWKNGGKAIELVNYLWGGPLIWTDIADGDDIYIARLHLGNAETINQTNSFFFGFCWAK